MKARLSVVVGTLNRLDKLRTCVESIAAQSRTPTVVYVTDAGSTDGTIEYLRSVASDRLVPIFVGRRLGQARAYNDVFARVDTPYVAWLSDDNEIVNRGLDVAVRVLDENPDVGMVGLKVRDRTGPFSGGAYIGGVSAIGILNVNQGVLRTSVLREVGGFSVAFSDYGIDPDLTAKVLFSGHTIVYTRRVAVLHHRGWPVDSGPDAYRRMREKQERYLSLYLVKYDPDGRLNPLGRPRAMTPWRRLKRAVARLLFPEYHARVVRQDESAAPVAYIPRRALRHDLDLFFFNTRDIRNILASRFISLWDPILTAGLSYHLVQVCPPERRLATLPPDPALPLPANS